MGGNQTEQGMASIPGKPHPLHSASGCDRQRVGCFLQAGPPAALQVRGYQVGTGCRQATSPGGIFRTLWSQHASVGRWLCCPFFMESQDLNSGEVLLRKDHGWQCLEAVV